MQSQPVARFHRTDGSFGPAASRPSRPWPYFLGLRPNPNSLREFLAPQFNRIEVLVWHAIPHRVDLGRGPRCQCRNTAFRQNSSRCHCRRRVRRDNFASCRSYNSPTLRLSHRHRPQHHFGLHYLRGRSRHCYRRRRLDPPCQAPRCHSNMPNCPIRLRIPMLPIVNRFFHCVAFAQRNGGQRTA